MDIESLAKSLKEHNVEFVIIGGVALPVHGYARATLDIDVFIRATIENARRTLKALQKFGYDVEDLTEDDLIAMKHAAGREKDKEDLKVLEEIRQRLAEKQ